MRKERDFVMTLLHRIGQRPIIAALRSPNDIDNALASNVDNIFFMGGTIKEIIQAVQLAKEAKKGAFVHLDLIKGLSNNHKEAVEFIADYVGADGIISPKSNIIREAKKKRLFGILHLFILDSLALEKGLDIVQSVQPDALEIMPGVISKAIQSYSEKHEEIPVIASGLIQSKEEAAEALQAGATSLSVSNKELWNLSFEDLF